MSDISQRTRCPREVSIHSNEFRDWEATPEGGAICPACVTADEQQAIDESDMALEAKVRENRLRRMADRQGLALVKSRRRDPRSIDYGRFMVVDNSTNTVVAGELNSPRALDMDEVEKYLTSG
ncbi:MAG TPA: hypothetical protein VJ782_10055 [Aeromicrobium sp.]|nr:hypothetical protein [Aeromicrobium sp.]